MASFYDPGVLHAAADCHAGAPLIVVDPFHRPLALAHHMSTLTHAAAAAMTELVPIEPSLAASAPPTPSATDSLADDDEPWATGSTQSDVHAPLLDAASGEPVYACTHCDKKYTGKHARSIWRRHLQDKHAIPLSQQPRRTRWDNVLDRPKTDTERRKRTLESKRRWARKNRAVQRAKAAGLPVPADADFDEDGYPLPGTELAALVGATARRLPACGDSSASAVSTPAYAPIDVGAPVPSLELDDRDFDFRPRLGRAVELAAAAARSPVPMRRAASLAPPAAGPDVPSSRLFRQSSEPPGAAYGASSRPSAAAPPRASHLPRLSAEPWAEVDADRRGGALRQLTLDAPLYAAPVYARSLFDASSPEAERSGGRVRATTATDRPVGAGGVDVSSELATASTIAGRLSPPPPAQVALVALRRSPRRPARDASVAGMPTSEEAALQLLALKTSSPVRGTDQPECSFATSNTDDVTDFSFQLPHDGSSPATSPGRHVDAVDATGPGKRRAAAAMSESDGPAGDAPEHGTSRASKRLRTRHGEDAGLFAESGPLLACGLPPSSPDDTGAGQAPEAAAAAFCLAPPPPAPPLVRTAPRAAQEAAAPAGLLPQSTPFQLRDAARIFGFSPAQYDFSSPGNTDLSRSLGLVPQSSMPAFYGDGAIKGSSPTKPCAMARALAAPSSPAS